MRSPRSPSGRSSRRLSLQQVPVRGGPYPRCRVCRCCRTSSTCRRRKCSGCGCGSATSTSWCSSPQGEREIAPIIAVLEPLTGYTVGVERRDHARAAAAGGGRTRYGARSTHARQPELGPLRRPAQPLSVGHIDWRLQAPSSKADPCPATSVSHPSPTGRLHIGNIRTAVLNWLAARKSAGTFLLRLDDTDNERSTEEFADGIKRDLAWLGLGWDRLERQSGRLARYGEVAERLKAAGRLYPCFETADELDRRRKRQQARGLPPIYDRAATETVGGGSGQADRRRTPPALAVPARQLRRRPRSRCGQPRSTGRMASAASRRSISARSPIRC